MGLLSHAKYDPNRQWEVGIRSSQIKIFKQIVAFWQIFGPKWQRYIAFPLFPLAPHIFFPSFALCTFPAPPFLLCFVPFYVLFLFISSLSPFLSPLYVSSLSLSFISFSFFFSFNVFPNASIQCMDYAAAVLVLAALLWASTGPRMTNQPEDKVFVVIVGSALSHMYEGIVSTVSVNVDIGLTVIVYWAYYP